MSCSSIKTIYEARHALRCYRGLLAEVRPRAFEFEFDEIELSAHGITSDEAVEVIWNGFDVRRNKRYHGGYQIVGRTDGGRTLKLIVYEKRTGVIRVITGWDI